MAEPTHELVVVTDADGKTGAFGMLQRDWLLEHGYIERTPGTMQHEFLSTRLSVFELDKLVQEQRELRECDFCQTVPTEFQINLRHPIDSPPPTPGPITRPLYACGTCAHLVRMNRRSLLIERMIEVPRQRVRPDLAPAVAKAALEPQISVFVSAMFSARKGLPVRQ
jgi:hypothetical protein